MYHFAVSSDHRLVWLIFRKSTTYFGAANKAHKYQFSENRTVQLISASASNFRAWAVGTMLVGAALSALSGVCLYSQ